MMRTIFTPQIILATLTMSGILMMSNAEAGHQVACPSAADIKNVKLNGGQYSAYDTPTGLGSFGANVKINKTPWVAYVFYIPAKDVFDTKNKALAALQSVTSDPAVPFRAHVAEYESLFCGYHSTLDPHTIVTLTWETGDTQGMNALTQSHLAAIQNSTSLISQLSAQQYQHSR